MSADPRPRRTLADQLGLLFASGFGSGYSPVVSGTTGTMMAWVIAYLLSLTGLPAAPTIAALVVVTTLGSILLGGRIEALTGKKDPGVFVLDEFAGYYVALLTLRAEWPDPGEYLVAFVLFRIFDVLKPTPARQAQNLKGGLGIVVDDLVAGVYALLGVIVYRQVLQNPPW